MISARVKTKALTGTARESYYYVYWQAPSERYMLAFPAGWQQLRTETWGTDGQTRRTGCVS